MASSGFDMNSLVLRIIPSDSTIRIKVDIAADFLIPPTRIVAARLPETVPAFSKYFPILGETFLLKAESG